MNSEQAKTNIHFFFYYMLCLIMNDEDGKSTFDLLDISQGVKGHESAE